MASIAPIKISFVIPCYSSESTISEVVERLSQTVEKQFSRKEYEIILVDDCSPDNTFETLCKLSEKFSNVKVIGFAKNFGQQAAILAGFNSACGSLVACLDDDGQTRPEDFFKLLDKLNEGYDLVYAQYPKYENSRFRKFGSSVNDMMANMLLGKPKNLTLSSYFICKRFLVESAKNYKNPYPYLSGQMLASTSSIANVEVEHASRLSGTSGYTIRKLLSLWLNGFTAFSITPLRISSALGFVFACLGLIASLVVFFNRIINPEVPIGWSSTACLILVLGGLVLFSLGLIGEYLGRVYISINSVPQYVIKHVVDKNEGVNNS